MKIKIRKKYLFFVLAFISTIITAIVSGFDATAQIYITNPWELGLGCFIWGVIISFIITIILSIPYKNKSIGEKTIDPSFKRIRLLTKKEIPYHILAGLGNAILTIGYFFLLSMFGDPSIVLPFSQVVILYLVLIESITEKDTPTLVEIQSSVIVTFGAILGSISLSGTLSIEALLIVFLVINPGWVLLSTFQRKLKLMKINDKVSDAINIRLWNVILACLFTALFIFIFDKLNGTNYLVSGIYASFTHYFWLVLIAIGVFFSFIFYIRALGIGKASVTQAVKATVIIFSIPVSIFLGYFETSDPVLLLIKLMGIILMMLGILSFALTLTKAYVFIKMIPGYDIEEVMTHLWKINGVNRVCAVAGPYDFIIKIRTRTLIKGYERIIKKVENVPGIAEYRWQSVLKEWEDI